jgi:hypothetical protein
MMEQNFSWISARLLEVLIEEAIKRSSLPRHRCGGRYGRLCAGREIRHRAGKDSSQLLPAGCPVEWGQWNGVRQL